jgi:Protein of unknown function (DUF2950)
MMKLSVSAGCKLRRLLVRRPAVCAALVLAVAAAACSRNAPESPAGLQTFASPDAAAQAVYDAARANDTDAVLRIFGPTAKEFLVTGDPTHDLAAFKEFTDDYDHMHRWGKLLGGDRVLIVGVENYPFPFPLRKSTDGRWQFDAEGGRQEFLARGIGDNELTIMGVLDALANAQVEYYGSPRDGSKLQQYAQRFISSPGKKDGLYWSVAAGEPESPIGPLVAQAAKNGSAEFAAEPSPFHGYFFRMLTKQGSHAAGGARNYIVDGHMVGGFAFLAYPAEYRKTGVMSFLVSQDGDLFQKDLGPQTAQVAESVTAFDPDPSWSAVQ